MAPTHAQIARNLLATTPPGVFAAACQKVVTHNDFTLLERMLPGMKFASRKVSQVEWELVGTAVDGSTCVWRLG